MIPKIIIYKRDLLPLSETFVRDQAEFLDEFTPIFVGRHRVKGLDLPESRTLVVNEGGRKGKMREAAFVFLQWEPQLLARLRALGPVLIHAHFEDGGVGAMGLAKALNIPLVTGFWGADVTVRDELRFPNTLRRALYQWRRMKLQATGDLFLAVSGYIRTKMLAKGYDERKTHVHYAGVDTSKFTPDPAVAREPAVLFVGRLVEKKGCEYLIRAMAEVEKTRPNAELVIIGDGPLRGALEAQAAETVPRCRFLGAQPHDVVRQWLNRASIFSLPSITASSGDTEGLPTVLAEAHSMGLPCASFVHSGIPEVVEDGVTGFLTEEKDWQGLATNIGRLLDDAALWQRFSEEALKRMRESFDLRVRTRILEGWYRSAIAARE